jgi:hypothetical protein
VDLKTPELTNSVDSDSETELKPRVLKFIGDADSPKNKFDLAATSSSSEEGRRGKEVKREERRGTKDKRREKEGKEGRGEKERERKGRSDKGKRRSKPKMREGEGRGEEDRITLPKRSKTEDGTRQKTRAVDIRRTKEKEPHLADSEESDEEAAGGGGWRTERTGGGSWGALGGSPSRTGFWIETASLKGRGEEREDELAGSDEDSEEARPASGKSTKARFSPSSPSSFLSSSPPPLPPPVFPPLSFFPRPSSPFP